MNGAQVDAPSGLLRHLRAELTSQRPGKANVSFSDGLNDNTTNKTSEGHRWDKHACGLLTAAYFSQATVPGHKRWGFFLLLFLAYPYTREFIMFARRVSLSGHYDFNFNEQWEKVLLAVYVLWLRFFLNIYLFLIVKK